MSLMDYDNGWNDALKVAHENIQQFALQHGLDTESSAYSCDQIVESLIIVPCQKCFRIHDAKKGCGILAETRVRILTFPIRDY